MKILSRAIARRVAWPVPRDVQDVMTIPWTPDTESQANLIQWLADSNAGAALSYAAAAGLPTNYVKDYSTSGTVRLPLKGTCWDFDGTNDLIDVGNIAAAVKTIAFKVKVDSLAGTDYVIDLNGTDYITIVTGTVTKNGFAGAAVTIYVDDAASSTIPDTTAWHTVVIVSDTGFTASDLDIARLEGTGYYNGKMREVMLFTDQLSAAERTWFYNRATGTSPGIANCVGWWDASEQNGDIVFDKSGNGNDGTITNATLSTFWDTTSNTTYSPANEVGGSRVVYMGNNFNHRITIANTVDFSGENWTLSGAVYFSSIATTQALFSQLGSGGGKDWLKIAATTGAWGTGIGAGATFSVIDGAIANQWYVWSLVKSGTTFTLTVNGVSDSATLTMGSAPTEFHIGVNNYKNNIPLNGYISNILLDHASGFHLPLTDDPRILTYFVDISGNNKHGAKTLGNPVSVVLPRDESDTTNDISGRALGFSGRTPYPALPSSPCWTGNGTDDFIDIGNQASSVKSIAFQVRPDSITAHTDYVIDLNGTDYITIVNGTVTVNGFAAATTAIYVDGQLSSTVTIASQHRVMITSDTGFTASDLDIGRLEGTGYHDGKLCDVRIWTTQQTAAQALYYGTLGKHGIAPSTPAAQWPLGEGSTSTTAYNVVANANHGTLSGSGGAAGWWANSQTKVHYVLDHGCKLSGSIRIPALLSGASAADGGAITDPAGALLNTGPATFDLTGGVNSPAAATQGWNTSYRLGHGRFNPSFRKAIGLRRMLSFDGSSDSVSLGDVAALQFERTNSFSISAFVRFAASGAQNVIFAKQLNSGTYRGYSVIKDSSEKLLFSVVSTYPSNYAQIQGSTALSINTWYHVCVTYDGSSSTGGMTIYLNGVAETPTPVANTLSATTLNAEVGRIGSRETLALSMNGLISEVTVYNSELTSGNVTYLESHGDSGDDPGAAIGDWPLNTATSTAYDYSANANHGTVTGAVTILDVGYDSKSPPNQDTRLLGYDAALGDTTDADAYVS